MFFRLHGFEPSLARVDMPEVEVDEGQEPAVRLDLAQTDVLAAEDLEHAAFLVQVNVPALRHHPCLIVERVGRFRRGLDETALGWAEEIGWRSLSEGLVRAFAVEHVDETVEAFLLREEVRSPRAGGLLLEREVHALVAAVLLGVGGLDAFVTDTEPAPPHGQSTQARQRRRSEG